MTSSTGYSFSLLHVRKSSTDLDHMCVCVVGHEALSLFRCICVVLFWIWGFYLSCVKKGFFLILHSWRDFPEGVLLEIRERDRWGVQLEAEKLPRLPYEKSAMNIRLLHSLVARSYMRREDMVGLSAKEVSGMVLSVLDGLAINMYITFQPSK